MTRCVILYRPSNSELHTISIMTVFGPHYEVADNSLHIAVCPHYAEGNPSSEHGKPDTA